MFAVQLSMLVAVYKAVVAAAVLAPVDRLRVAADVNLRVAQVRVQLIDDRRTHVNKVYLTDVAKCTLVDVEHA